MKSFRLSLRTKLVLSFLAIIVLGGLLSLVIGSRLIRDTLVSQAQAKVRHDLSAAWMVFNEKLNNIQEVVRLTAARESLLELLATRRIDILSRYLNRVRTENGLDVLTLLDAQGRVLLRTRAPGSAGTDLSSDPMVRLALGRRTVAAPQIISRRELLNEGGDLAERARMTRLPTPRAAPRPANEETSGMVLESASPILAEGGAVAGVLIGGDPPQPQLRNRRPGQGHRLQGRAVQGA